MRFSEKLMLNSTKGSPFIFFAQDPTRDKRLDGLRENKCPDCNNDTFKISNNRDITILECGQCAGEFVMSPTTIERLNKKPIDVHLEGCDLTYSGC